MKKRLIPLVMMILAAAVFATGCYTTGNKKNRPTKTSGQTSEWGDVVIGPDGTLVYGDLGMGDERMGDQLAIAPQFESIHFDFDSQQLAYSEQVKIDAVVAYLQQNPTLGVVVEGNCDERGSSEYNLALGERRALAVRASMISRGIDGSRVQTKSYGEERPVAFGHDETAWRMNRRADFIFIQL